MFIVARLISRGNRIRPPPSVCRADITVSTRVKESKLLQLDLRLARQAPHWRRDVAELKVLREERAVLLDRAADREARLEAAHAAERPPEPRHQIAGLISQSLVPRRVRICVMLDEKRPYSAANGLASTSTDSTLCPGRSRSKSPVDGSIRLALLTCSAPWRRLAALDAQAAVGRRAPRRATAAAGSGSRRLRAARSRTPSPTACRSSTPAARCRSAMARRPRTSTSGITKVSWMSTSTCAIVGRATSNAAESAFDEAGARGADDVPARRDVGKRHQPGAVGHRLGDGELAAALAKLHGDARHLHRAFERGDGRHDTPRRGLRGLPGISQRRKQQARNQQPDGSADECGPAVVAGDHYVLRGERL